MKIERFKKKGKEGKEKKYMGKVRRWLVEPLDFRSC